MITIIKIDSESYHIIENEFIYWLSQGYLLKRAYTKKMFILFGEKRYFIQMQAGLKIYKHYIQDAIEKENYELAGQLTGELKTLNF